MLGGGISNEGVIFNLLEYIKMDGYVLPDLKLTVYTPKNENKKEERTLHDVLAEGPKIIFKFSQYGCSSCIIEQIEHLKILEQEKGYRNIILITDRIPADIARCLRAAKVHFQIFLVDEADLLHEYDKSLIPYVFRTEGIRIVNSMVLSRETLEYSRYFYEQFN